MANAPTFRPFGWQGIRLEIPLDWSLSRIEGTREKGYLRLDDDAAVRGELRWETPRKVGVPFEEIVDGFVAQMRKQAGRKARLDITRNVKLNAPPNREWDALRCGGDVRAWWLLSRCPDCHRFVAISLMPRPGESVRRELAEQIFCSLADHSADGLDLWDVYDVRFKLPPSLLLRNTQLRTGCIEMTFSDGPREVHVQRVALAEILLRNRTVADWAQRVEAKTLKGFDYEVYTATMHGHDAVRLLGRMPLARRLRGRKARSVFYHAYAWHCPEQDNLYLFRATTGDEEDESFESCAQTLQCHGS